MVIFHQTGSLLKQRSDDLSNADEKARNVNNCLICKLTTNFYPERTKQCVLDSRASHQLKDKRRHARDSPSSSSFLILSRLRNNVLHFDHVLRCEQFVGNLSEREQLTILTFPIIG